MRTNLEKFKEDLLEKIYNGTIKNVYVDDNVKDYRQDDIWFGGSLIGFDYHNLGINIKAVGDVRCEIIYRYKNGTAKSEYIVDKNNNGELGNFLKSNNIFKDSEITYSRKEFFPNHDKKAFLNYENGNNNWIEIVIFDKKHNKYIDNYETFSLSEIIDMGVKELIDYIKNVAEDNLDINYESISESEPLIEKYNYEKYEKTFCDYLNLKYENLENNKFEHPQSFDEWKKSDNNIDERSRNYTIEGMFKSKGVSKVFDDRGIFTKEALEKYDEVSDEFFDGITDNLDKLCHEEECFEEDFDGNSFDSEVFSLDDIEY